MSYSKIAKISKVDSIVEDVAERVSDKIEREFDDVLKIFEKRCNTITRKELKPFDQKTRDAILNRIRKHVFEYSEDIDISNRV